MKIFTQLKQRFTLKPVSLIVTLTAFVILCKLGFWQLDRAAQKRLLLSEQTNQSISIDNLVKHAEKNSLQTLNLKRFEGEVTLWNDQIWLVDNKVYRGKVGYDVLVPAVIEPSQILMLVNLGWWPAPQSRSQLPEVRLPEHLYVKGLIKTDEFDSFTLTRSHVTEEFPQRIQTMDAAFTYSYSTPITTMVVFADSMTIADHPQLYKPVVMPPEKHVAYAVQWFLLALASVIVYVLASYKRTLNEN